MASDDEKKVRLRSKDGEVFEVPAKAIAAFSATIRGMIDEGCAAADGVVELRNVTAATLSRVLEYVERHFDSDDDSYPSSSFNPRDDDPLARFDEELVGGVDNDTLLDLVQAASFLGIGKLLDLTCKAVAEQMRGRTTDEIRAKFHIVNDYTEEEQEDVRKENSWALE